MYATLRRTTTRLSASEARFFLISFLILVSLTVALSIATTPYMAFATVAYSSLLAGILFRAQKRLHIPFMATGVFLDLALVGFLEITRSAIGTAIGGTLNPWQQGHIVFSTVAAALYLPTIFFGARAALKPKLGTRAKPHIYLGRVAFFCRTAGFILMFSLLEHVKK